jgi:uncharacterized protein YgbK (DUF1537 family)
MLLGAVADDFTGASDLANTLAKGGMATMQFVGAGVGPAPTECEAGVVALKTRSVPAAQAVSQSVEAACWLLGQGCRQIIFKYCSTFDSTPDGNIGPVAEALSDLLGSDIAVVCPAFPATGRRVFMGHLFVGDRLLNESGMEKHPLTPMTDADLRRWLRRQTQGEVGHVPLDAVRGPTLAAAFAAEARAGRRLVVADAVSDADLMTLGAAIADHRLVTGGSGIALGLPRNFRASGLLADGETPLPEVQGPAVVLCGSCSIASQRQVAAYLETAEGLAVDPSELMRGEMTAERAADWVGQWNGRGPIIYSTAAPEVVAGTQQRFGRAEIAAAIERFFGDVARILADKGTRRIVVGGGETSGAVVEGLGLRSLRIGKEIDPGVPALVADRQGPIGLALKSGNFGGPDFFAKAIDRIGSA